MTFHSQLDAWNDFLQALVFGLQALIVAMPMLGLDAATAALDDVAVEKPEHFAAADEALRTRLFSMLVVGVGRDLRVQSSDKSRPCLALGPPQ